MKTCLLTQCSRLLGTTVLVLAALLTQFTPAVWAQAGTDLPCSQTPFGHTLAIGQENEIFVGLRSADNTDPGRLTADQFDPDPTTGQLKDQALVPDILNEPTNVSAVAGVTADLDGDGKVEFVQGYTSANGQYQVVVRKNGAPAVQTHTENWPNHTNRALAAGDILGQDNGSQEVVIASRDADGVLNVAVFANAAGGVGSPVALWRANVNGRGQATQIRVAVGNLDNDPYADIVVSFLQSDQHTDQLIYLEYQPNFQSGSGANLAQNLQERATRTILIDGGIVSPQNVKMIMANLSSSTQANVIVAWDHQDPSGLTPVLFATVQGVADINGVTQFVDRAVWYTNASARSFDLAAGDVNGDHRDELIVGYDTSSPSTANFLNIVTLALTAQDTPNPTLTELDRWQDGADGRNRTNDLALAVGDLDKDFVAEVVAAFQDASPFGYQTLYLKRDGNGHLQLKDWGRHDATINAPPNLALGDWDNNSLRAFVKGKCANVVDADIRAVNFIPPWWQNIQSAQYKAGSLGRTVTQEDTVEHSLSYSHSSSESFYVGGGFDAEIPDIFSASAVAKATGAQEYAMSNTKTNSTTNSKSTSVGLFWFDDAVVYEPASYNCYSYELAVNNVFIPPSQAHLRFCEYQALKNAPTPHQASELNSWDTNYGAKPEFLAAPRDWTSLALFRGAFTDQSSNATTAPLAVDSEIVHGSFVNGTLAQTANENQPWWQVDLGASQPIGKLRLWAPQGSLRDFYVFVSDTDFRTLPGQADPNNLLNQPSVRHYTLADLGNGFAMTDTAPLETTFLTLDPQTHQPIQGRYVRVQRADAGVLTLAEVQVFGANHVDPDRYPMDLCDDITPKTQGSWCDITQNDGYFKVRLYNPWYTSDADRYMTVKTRGHLIWDGRANTPLNALTVARGNAGFEWSMSNANVTSKAQAYEIANNTTTGVAYEAEAGGGGIKVVGGYAKEQTQGVTNETVESTSWSNEINMGGIMSGFPKDYDQPWAARCIYRAQPYYYQLTETSNLGHQLSFPVLDYLVPQENAAVDLFRTNDLTACRNGNQPATAPQTANDTAQVVANTPITLSVLANDLGNNLTITDVGKPQHGQATYKSRTIAYTPDIGFTGTDTFTYTVNSNTVVAATTNATTTGTVVVTVSSPGTSVYLPLIQH